VFSVLNSASSVVKKNIMEKNRYKTPQIDLIELDNEISLALTSAPPAGPGEVQNNSELPEYLNSNPLKINKV
jgi:hypothetical protein